MKYLSTIPGIVGTAVAYWILTWFLPTYAALLAVAFILAASVYTLFEDKVRLMRFSAISFACSVWAINLAIAAIYTGNLWPILAMIVSLITAFASWNLYKDSFDELNIKGSSLKPILYYIIALALIVYLAPQIFPIPPRLAGKF